MPKPNLFQGIATQCNVSPASVTLALQDSPRISEETKYRVYLAARELGYRRSKFRGNKHLQFAIFHARILPIQSMSSNTQFEIWYGVARAINQIDATLNIFEMDLQDGAWNFASLPSPFKRDQCDGVIVTGAPGKEFLDFLHSIHMPVVVASNTDIKSNVDHFCFDFNKATRGIMESVLAGGKRRIGFVSPGARHATHQSMLQGYSEAMREAGCFDERLIATTDDFYDLEGKLPNALFDRVPDIEALFATNPRTAHHAALAAALRGIPAPDGLELISLQSELHRELRYRQRILFVDLGQLGQSAVDRLLERRAKPDLPTCTVLLQCRQE